MAAPVTGSVYENGACAAMRSIRLNEPYVTFLYVVRSFLSWQVPVPKPFHLSLFVPIVPLQNCTESTT
jgi:hypothetical protein